MFKCLAAFPLHVPLYPKDRLKSENLPTGFEILGSPPVGLYIAIHASSKYSSGSAALSLRSSTETTRTITRWYFQSDIEQVIIIGILATEFLIEERVALVFLFDIARCPIGKKTGLAQFLTCLR